LKPTKGEILDIFYYPVEQLRDLGYHDPSQAPEWDELFGAPPTPEQQDLALRARETSARLIWKPYAFNPRLPHFLPRVTNPTLIVWGREDRIVPLICGEQYAQLLPNATLKVIESCGHSPNIERPDEYVELLRDFLSPTTDHAATEARR
jgi:pimeloyl-ACP methyl ester carboxylesterase